MYVATSKHNESKHTIVPSNENAPNYRIITNLVSRKISSSFATSTMFQSFKFDNISLFTIERILNYL